MSDNEPVTRKLQTFRAGSLLCGVFEDEVSLIADWRKPTPLPHAPPSILGVVSIQGRMLTVIDVQVLFNEGAKRSGSQRGFILALRGEEQIALATTKTGDVIDYLPENLTPTTEPTAEFVLASIRHGDQDVKVLDVPALFPATIKGSERRRRRF